MQIFDGLPPKDRFGGGGESGRCVVYKCEGEVEEAKKKRKSLPQNTNYGLENCSI